MNEIRPTPTAIVLGGINGAGKTTASRSLLANTLKVLTFVRVGTLKLEDSLRLVRLLKEVDAYVNGLR